VTKNLFEAAAVDEVKRRMAQLRPDSERLWGKMNAAQALAHCSVAKRLRESIDRFAAAGPGICTTHPHFFFGPLTPVEWATLMYQHLDHNLRQFQV